jgi:hypothetical protein
MNKLLIGLASVPLMSSVAFAGQPLSDKQMDAVTAGFSAFSTSLVTKQLRTLSRGDKWKLQVGADQKQ